MDGAGTHRLAVRRLVEEYCRLERNPALPKFEVHGPLFCSAVFKHQTVHRAGCYVIFDEVGRLRYVGMSETAISKRLRIHLNRVFQATNPFWLHARAHTIDLIEVANGWEAPSLEAYLTVKSASLRQETWPVGKSAKGTTEIGYENKNGQIVLQQTDRLGTDHGQRVYELRCSKCDNVYGANGSDIWLRRCPNCQGGKPGI